MEVVRLSRSSRARIDAVVDVGPLLVCETCEMEVDVVDGRADRGVCRHCGIAFMVDVAAEDDARRVG